MQVLMIEDICYAFVATPKQSNAVFMKPGSKRKNIRKGASPNDRRDSACHPAATNFNHYQSQAKEDN
jgi:hypothetical protein